MLNNIREKFTNLPLRTRITIVTTTIILIGVISGITSLIKNVYQALEMEQGKRVIAIARTVAQLESIKENIGKIDGAKVIQPIAERIRIATDVDYVVVFDMRKIRYSHPEEKKIGTLFQGGDEENSLRGKEYVSFATGINGLAIRSFVPIMDVDGFEQIGVVVVGTVLPDVYQLIYLYRLDIIGSILIGVIVGIFGAWLLTKSIKRQLFNMEPIDIVRLVEEREAMLNAIGEGIIAIDSERKVRLINKQAAKMLELPYSEIGFDLQEKLPNCLIFNVLNTKEPITHQLLQLNNTIVMAYIMPIIIKKKIIGAIMTFQDRTEMRQMAEELTGIRKFSDSLRAQNHEYMNKLHTIAGLIQLQRNEEALDLIFNYTEEQEEIVSFLAKNIKSASISGLILGKLSHARELGIHLNIDRTSFLPKLPSNIRINDLVVIIGNLLENGIDAVKSTNHLAKEVYLKIVYTQGEIVLVVKDNGTGISDHDLVNIFQLGFTTKEKGHGVGLALVKQNVDFYHGTIHVESKIGVGTTFIVTIPLEEYNGKEDFTWPSM